MDHARWMIVAAVCAVIGCEHRYQGGTLLLDWTDSETGIVFRVTQDPPGFLKIKSNPQLWVETADGEVRSDMIDDDARFGRIAFVRYQDWLLVLNNEYVLAGYNYNANALYGEYEWDELPFTVRKHDSGTEVASDTVSAYCYLPNQFPHVEDGD